MRHVLITGGGSGIGREAARAFLAAGMAVTIVGRDEERLRAARGELDPAGARLACRACDVGRAADTEALAAWLIETGRRVDVLVNCAGLFLAAPMLKAGEEQAADMWQVHVMGPWRLLRACAAPGLRGSGGLSVVNVLSVTALKPYPACGFYGATKAALKSLMETARAELRDKGVRISNIYPGATETPIWGGRDMDHGRMMDAADVAAAIVACAADTPRSLVEDLVLRPAGGDL